MVRYYCKRHRRATTSPGYKGYDDTDFTQLTPSARDGDERCGAADGACPDKPMFVWDGAGEEGPDPEA